MIDFEKWFADQDFYTNMRFIHGDALFAKDGDVYRVLPVQMTYVAWSEKHVEYAELRQVSVALNTETINQRRYIVSKQSEITQLKAQLIDQGQRFNEQSQKVRDLEHFNKINTECINNLVVQKSDYIHKISMATAHLDSFDHSRAGMNKLVRSIESALEALRGTND